MKPRIPNTLLAFALSAFVAAARAAGPDDAAGKATLHVGDHAPELHAAKWLKGEPVEKLESGKLYVVEFWATWCGPCRQSIPHLTKLQKDHPEITFIGMDISEQEPAKAPDFVKSMGDKMDYRVAQDDTAGAANKAWMEAADQEGIPTAFVIGKDTTIQWIGHPLELDKVLDEVATGTFDSKKASAEASAKTAMEEELTKALQSGDVASLDKAAKDHPDLAGQIRVAMLGLALNKKDYDTAVKVARQVVEDQKDNVDTLNDIAWLMVDPKTPIEKPDLDLALKAAQRSNELAKGENPAVLDTLARVYFSRGDVDKAIELQTSAISKSGDDLKEDLGKTLSEYKAKKDAGK